MFREVMMTRRLFLLTLFFTGGCSLMGGGTTHGYSPDDDYASYAAQKNGTAEALDQLGWTSSRPLAPEERDVLEKRIRLNHLEEGLTSEKEREQYFGYKPYLDTDDDKIAFLSLPTMEARDRFATEKGIYSHASHYSPPVKEAVNRSDIILGMNMAAVTDSWGEPQTREVAGNAMYGNERWLYTDYIPSPEGYEKQDRVVFFESGKVVGWERQ